MGDITITCPTCQEIRHTHKCNYYCEGELHSQLVHNKSPFGPTVGKVTVMCLVCGDVLFQCEFSNPVETEEFDDAECGENCKNHYRIQVQYICTYGVGSL